jgi:hypothetical protein
MRLGIKIISGAQAESPRALVLRGDATKVAVKSKPSCDARQSIDDTAAPPCRHSFVAFDPRIPCWNWFSALIHDENRIDLALVN